MLLITPSSIGTMCKATYFSEKTVLLSIFFSLFICRLVLFLPITTTAFLKTWLSQPIAQKAIFLVLAHRLIILLPLFSQGLNCGHYIFRYLCFFVVVVTALIHSSHIPSSVELR